MTSRESIMFLRSTVSGASGLNLRGNSCTHRDRHNEVRRIQGRVDCGHLCERKGAWET